MVSIGVPEKGRQLIQHLQLPTEEFRNILFVDPENTLYDTLELNRGVQRTFMNFNTPFSFVRRFKEKDGMKDLLSVLSNWKDGTFYDFSSLRCHCIFSFLFVLYYKSYHSLSFSHFFKIILFLSFCLWVRLCFGCPFRVLRVVSC